jgi:hypothetical protein
MARLPWVAQIRNSRNAAEQTNVLRALKNEIVGHPPQKELVVTSGVLEPIIRLTFNKNGTRQDGKVHDHSFASRPLSEEELVRLQCLQVIASIALGQYLSIPLLEFADLINQEDPLSFHPYRPPLFYQQSYRTSVRQTTHTN